MPLCVCVSVFVCLCVSVCVCVNVCISLYIYILYIVETVEGKLPWNEELLPSVVLDGFFLFGRFRGNIDGGMTGQHWASFRGLDIPSTGNSCHMPVAPGHVRQWHTCNWNILGAGGPIGHAEMWNDGLWLMEVDERFSISVSSTQPPTISKPQSRLKTVTISQGITQNHIKSLPPAKR